MQILADISGDTIRRSAEVWAQAISGPRQFLDPSFHPNGENVSAAIEFFIAMVAVSTVLSIAGGLTQKGGAGEKIGGAVSGFLGLFFGAICAIAAHLPFTWFGGNASLSGTYLAYCYSAGPYIPLISFTALIMLSGFPARYRVYAINPATAQLAFANAQHDPETSNFNLFLGVILTWGTVIWSNIVMFRSLSFVHSLTGWQLAGAIVISFIFFGIVNKVLQRLSSLFLPPAPSPSVTAEPSAQNSV